MAQTCVSEKQVVDVKIEQKRCNWCESDQLVIKTLSCGTKVWHCEDCGEDIPIDADNS